MPEDAKRAAIPSDLVKFSRFLRALLRFCLISKLLGQGGMMALEPILLGFGSVDILMPELNDGVAAFRSERDTRAQSGSFERTVSPPFLTLVGAPGDGECEQLSTFEGSRCNLSISAVRACKSCTLE